MDLRAFEVSLYFFSDGESNQGVAAIQEQVLTPHKELVQVNNQLSLGHVNYLKRVKYNITVCND